VTGFIHLAARDLLHPLG